MLLTLMAGLNDCKDSKTAPRLQTYQPILNFGRNFVYLIVYQDCVDYTITHMHIVIYAHLD